MLSPQGLKKWLHDAPGLRTAVEHAAATAQRRDSSATSGKYRILLKGDGQLITGTRILNVDGAHTLALLMEKVAAACGFATTLAGLMLLREDGSELTADNFGQLGPSAKLSCALGTNAAAADLITLAVNEKGQISSSPSLPQKDQGQNDPGLADGHPRALQALLALDASAKSPLRSPAPELLFLGTGSAVRFYGLFPYNP